MRSLELNAVLASGHPGASALLSPLARRAAMPLGIPQQTAQARGCVRQATIGEITAGDGTPLALPSLARNFDGMEPRSALLYAPQHGLVALRSAWREHVDEGPDTPMSLPVVTSGITHGLSLCADLFTSPEVPVVLGTPFWDNYEMIFTLRTGAPLVTFPFFDAARRFNVKGLAERLAALRGPSVVLLNFPANPTGYSPLAEEVPAIVAALARHPHPIAVVCDDAYNGLFFGEGLFGRSLYGELARRLDPARALVCKVDGATKEMVFFGGRVGFLTFSADGTAGQALAEKAAAVLRGTISSCSAPAQTAVLNALASPALPEERGRVLAVLRRRWQALRDALAAHDVDALPFNSGCFALLPLPDSLQAEAVRQRLIRDHSVGVISVPSANALRVAFCSIDADDIPDLVARLVQGIR